MPTAVSKDGTVIAYEKTGKGPSIILVNGALAHRKFYGEKDLATRLAKDFTVIFFDRRGRGESTDTKPYAVEREIEDIEALIDKAGGRAYLYGSSSGASLATLPKTIESKITKCVEGPISAMSPSPLWYVLFSRCQYTRLSRSRLRRIRVHSDTCHPSLLKWKSHQYDTARSQTGYIPKAAPKLYPIYQTE